MMGFPSLYYYAAIPKPLVLLVQILDAVKLFLSSVLDYLAIRLSSDDHLAPGSAAPAAAIASSSIKARLPVVQFARFAAEAEAEAVCAVCLGELEGRHEVRELGNCRHGFHVGCIDKWVDLGHVTCPLCRSQLLP